MKNVYLALVVAGIFFIIGIAVFPSLHDMWSSVDITGSSPIVAIIIKSVPYDVVAAIIVGAILIVKHKQNT